MATELLTLDEARRRMLTNTIVLGSESAPLCAAEGRVLRRDIVTTLPWPRFDHSTMDGYAIATSDLVGDGPFVLEVRGESAAGAPWREAIPNTSCRIFTGAPLPLGADAVVPQEHVRREGSHVHFRSAPRKGAFIRACGEDLAIGETAMTAGKRLTPGACVLAAMLDADAVMVSKVPSVALLPTGAELYKLGAKTPHGIPESISYGISALATQARAKARTYPIVPDDRDATTAAIERAFADADLVVTIGGVSVGDHDHVRAALSDVGASLDFFRVAIKPGKPLAFGRRGDKLFVGLPGNPSSAMVTFALFVMPLLRAMQGDLAPFGPRTKARLATPVARSNDRLEVARASFQFESDGVLEARAHSQQASGAATSLAGSDGLILVPAGAEPAPVGLVVDAHRWADF